VLVLASASPRRQELLRNAGFTLVVQPTQVPETPCEGELPRTFAERLAREKALQVARRRPDDFVLGADTIVVVDAKILGKPSDAADAARMLRLLSGRTHEVITGVCLVGPSWRRAAQEPQGLKPGCSRNSSGTPEGVPFHNSLDETGVDNRKLETAFEDVRSEITLVTMYPLSECDIESYIASGEPMDKAGSYGIQGIASRWIPRIEGDYCNVVGLPVALVCRMLREHGAI